MSVKRHARILIGRSCLPLAELSLLDTMMNAFTILMSLVGCVGCLHMAAT